MKFRLMSDLHLEFEARPKDFTPIPLQDDKDTVLILAGDIATGMDAEGFLFAMCKRFYKVVYVLGNHEFYNKEYNKIRRQWNDYPALPGNFILLDDHTVVVEDPHNSTEQVRLVGGTMWTDFDGQDWHKMNTAQGGMNDFYCIKFKETPERDGSKGYRKRKFLPMDTVRAHQQTTFAIRETLRESFDGETVVITHHLPHPLCVHRQFRNDPLNSAYVTNLDADIEEFDIAVWCHGHTHTNVDETVHGTRILCNPRGYVPHDLNKGFDEAFTFEV
jgi:predicted phosphodiesterase